MVILGRTSCALLATVQPLLGRSVGVHPRAGHGDGTSNSSGAHGVPGYATRSEPVEPDPPEGGGATCSGGGPCTHDRAIMSRLLYRLSYSAAVGTCPADRAGNPDESPNRESNPRPSP